MSGLLMSGLLISGLLMSGLLMSGLLISGLLISGFATTEPWRPFGKGEAAPGASISFTSTVTLARRSEEVTQTVREMLERGGMVTSTWASSGRVCENEAVPPAGWLAMLSR